MIAVIATITVTATVAVTATITITVKVKHIPTKDLPAAQTSPNRTRVLLLPYSSGPGSSLNTGSSNIADPQHICPARQSPVIEHKKMCSITSLDNEKFSYVVNSDNNLLLAELHVYKEAVVPTMTLSPIG
mgnify:CR=1 FL=1